ncbi:hypothetical protein [Catellatospora sp. NPDC049609]|uniref:hypothetical protein n=1 Tax=Catellatospora sp. NPDC049609 TaxID=3155505 RepID=UPI00342CABCC
MTRLDDGDPAGRPEDHPGGTGTWWVPRQRGSSEPPWPGSAGEYAAAPSAPTRKLCMLVYLEEELRREVTDQFAVWRRGAWAPCYAVDLIALLRHTRRARLLGAARDLLLSVLCAGVLVLLNGIWFAGRPAGMLVMALLAIGVGCLRWAGVRRGVTTWSALQQLSRYARRRTGQFLERMVAVALLLLLGGALVLDHQTGRASVGTLLGGLVLAWVVVAGFAVTGFLCARQVLTATDVRSGAESPVPGAAERRARAVTSGNVLVYSDARARSPLGPFIGAGQLLSHWTTPTVDVTRAADKKKPVRAVDLADLHRALQSAVVKADVATLECQHRLYVDGSSWAAMSELVGGRPAGPPPTHLDEARVLERILSPDPYQRGYLCIKATSADGGVVVTMLVRAMLEGELLHLEVNMHALPEVVWPREEENVLDRPASFRGRRLRALEEEASSRQLVVSRYRTYAAWQGVLAGTGRYWPTLLGAVPRFARTATAFLWHAAGRLVEGHRIAGGRFDFGAEHSLREYLALDQKMHHNAFVDIMAQSDRLQKRLVMALETYLRECNVNVAGFRAAAVTIINNRQQNVITNLQAGAVTFGDHSPAHGQTPAGRAGDEEG